MIDDMNAGVVIVGAGLAGVSAATGLRRRGFDRPITLINEELPLPYDRPPLSKELLCGDRSVADITLHNAEYYEEQRIAIKSGSRVCGIDREARTLRLEDGQPLSYSHLILATGARPRHLPVPPGSAPLTRLFYLRELGDAMALREHLAHDRHVLVVGAGFIGLEVAASARRLGCRVTVLEAGPRVIERAAPPVVSAFVQQVHQENGVEFRFGTQVLDVIEQPGSIAVHLASGEALAADAVLVGIGVIPNDVLAREAGLACDNGIVVDQHCCSSDPRIFAIGDVAKSFNPLIARHVRLEHWESARQTGEIAAATICGELAVNAGVPWVWSDQYHLNIQFLGWSDPRAEKVLRGEIGGPGWSLIEVLDKRVIGAVLINAGRDRRPIERLVMSRHVVDMELLADTDAALKKWVPA